jgi:hypothetical protein
MSLAACLRCLALGLPLFVAGMAGLANPTATAAPIPVPILLDTDIGPDCDDVGAVVLLHSLADRGEARLLGMACGTSSPWGAPCLDALNTYFGRPEIPVGTLKEAGFLDRPGYAEALARRYPHRLSHGSEAPDATDLYRRILANQPDASVVFVAVGPLRNLRRLLESGPDSHSPLSGRELVARKVTGLSCMGGLYPTLRPGQSPEFNFAEDAQSAQVVVDQWPSPILFSGGELGSGIMTGRRVALECPEHHPLTFAYGIYVGFGRDRESWDLTSVLAAVRPTDSFWPLSPVGINRVDAQGRNRFTPDPAGRHRHLVRREPVQPVEDLLEALLVGARPGPLDFERELTCFVRDGWGLVTAHGSAAGDESAKAAFDRSQGTTWYSKGGESWLQFQTANHRTYQVSSYALTSRSRDPFDWDFQASPDGGATWVTLDTQRQQVLGTGEGARRYRCTHTGMFGTYRIRFPAGPQVSLDEVSLSERVQYQPGMPVNPVRLDPSPVNGPPAALPGPWSYQEVNGPHVPGEARIFRSTFTVTGGGMGIGRWWQRNWDQFAWVHQTRPGDATLQARLVSQTGGSPEAIAGLMFRATADRESPMVALGRLANGELFLTWRDSPADENPRLRLGPVKLPIHLKLTRLGNRYEAYASEDGVTWGPARGRHLGQSATPLNEAGLWVTGALNPTTATAQFDAVEFGEQR